MLRGIGVLTPTQSTEAYDAWNKTWNDKEPGPFAAYRDTAFGLYQSFTQGLKLGMVQRKVDEYCGVTDLFKDQGLVDAEWLTVAEEAKADEARAF